MPVGMFIGRTTGGNFAHISCGRGRDFQHVQDDRWEWVLQTVDHTQVPHEVDI